MVIRINDRRKREGKKKEEEKKRTSESFKNVLVTVSLNTTEKFHGFVRTLLTTGEEQRVLPSCCQHWPSHAAPALGDSAATAGRVPSAAPPPPHTHTHRVQHVKTEWESAAWAGRGIRGAHDPVLWCLESNTLTSLCKCFRKAPAARSCSQERPLSV